jgi:uncharacterized protein (TIGR02145 family)
MKVIAIKFLKHLSILCFLVLSVYTCEEPEPQIAIETGSIIDISYSNVTATINIIDIGEGIENYGHIAATDSAFMVNVKKSSLYHAFETGVYSSTIYGLTPNTLYYVRAYATFSRDTVYGKWIDFATIQQETGTFTDSRDGQEYGWATIGLQQWMTENLAYLPAVSPSSEGSYHSPYYYVYGYEGTSLTSAKAASNYSTYGVLYNWPAAMNGASSSSSNPSGVHGVCPSGWHLPSDAEWTELTLFIGGEGAAGGRLKESGYDHWWFPNTDATNEQGFTALPGGYRKDDGTFSYIGGIGLWWSATEVYMGSAETREMGYLGAAVNPYFHVNGVGLSVRCVKDNSK